MVYAEYEHWPDKIRRRQLTSKLIDENHIRLK